MGETLYNILIYFTLCFMAILTFVYLFRTVIGPSFFDRILGVNNISTIVVLMICILAVVQKESYIVDIALIYAMLSFVTVVIVCKAYLRSHKKDRSHDFKNLKEKRENND
ncbi:MAG: monovalent cation/H+ antiporter complex subunit F [Clostridium sp.]